MLEVKNLGISFGGLRAVDGFEMQKLPILDEDLCVVLGNMLDNAIEASEKVTDRWINVSIGLRKNGLVIVVENSFDGIIKKNIHGNIISIKENKEHHGYGLKSIRKTVEKEKRANHRPHVWSLLQSARFGINPMASSFFLSTILA